MKNKFIKLIALMLTFITIFSVGCTKKPTAEDLAKEIFENEFPKIEKEVEGYHLEKIASIEDIEYNGYGYVDGIKYTFSSFPKMTVSREDGEERVLRAEDFVGTSETYDKIYNIYDSIDDDIRRRFSFRQVFFIDDMIFIIAVGKGQTYFWPNIFFLYDFYDDTLKYCGYAEEDAYPTKSWGLDGPVYFGMPEDNFYKVVKDS